MLRNFLNRRRFLVLTGIFLISIKMVWGQGDRISEIKKEQKKILEDIEFVNKKLEETGRKKNISTTQIRLINRKIREREKLINKYQQEIDAINEEINHNVQAIDSINEEIREVKRNYEIAVKKYYRIAKNGEDLLGYIFSATTLNQAYSRIRYIREFMSYLNTLYKKLEQSQIEIQNRNAQLIQMKNDRKMLVQEVKQERSQYIRDIEYQRKKVNTLANKEQQLRKDIQRKKTIAERLNKEIERILREEREKRNNKITLTPEENLLSEEFGKNQGLLPWPTEHGLIIERYGERSHPVLRNVKVRNDGIDIMTNRGEAARAIFGGTVSRVVAIPGANEVVIIRHGKYITVYQNLVNVNVRSGTKVKAKDKIGEVYTDRQSNETILHFELWNGRKTLNPEDWISKRKIN